MFVFGGWAWTKRAAKRQPAAKPLLTILVPAMLDDTHRAAMRAPSRLGKIDNLLADQRLQRPARHGFARQPFDPHTLFGRHRAANSSLNRFKCRFVHAHPPKTNIF